MPPLASTAQLAELADDNFVVHATYATGLRPGSRIAAAPDLVLVDSGLRCDTFNVAARARLQGSSAPARIDEAVAFFAAARHPFSWWLTPGYAPASLPVLLRQAGLPPVAAETAMGFDLAGRKLPASPPELRIRRVRSASGLAAFAALTAANWTPPEAHVLLYYEKSQAAFLEPGSPQRLYLGFLEEEPVAAAELTLSAGVAGIYNVTTALAFRGYGIGTEMTAAVLRKAGAAGARLAVLQASDDGVRLYRRLGFSAYGEVTEHKPATPADASVS